MAQIIMLVVRGGVEGSGSRCSDSSTGIIIICISLLYITKMTRSILYLVCQFVLLSFAVVASSSAMIS